MILVKHPAHRAGLPGKGLSFYMCPLPPPKRRGLRGTFRSNFERRRQEFQYWDLEFLASQGELTVEKKIRILIAKPGLDGHDRGAKVIAQALRDAGMEVIYTGLHQTIDQIISTAIQEDVDVIGLSIMSGAHLPICQKLVKKMEEKKIEDIKLVLGGVIPKRDVPLLREMGIEGIFPGGTPFDESIQWIKQHIIPRS